ncbi:hypothetical protein D3C71_2180550 [compost metagenome]
MELRSLFTDGFYLQAPIRISSIHILKQNGRAAITGKNGVAGLLPGSPYRNHRVFLVSQKFEYAQSM